MNPWLETLGVCVLGALGVLAGRGFSRLRKPYWSLGYVLPLLLICLIGWTRRDSAMEFIPPLSWLVVGRTEFVLSAFIITMILTTPLSRLRGKRLKVLVILFMAAASLASSVWPFLAPAFNRAHLASIKTIIDADGICLQSNDYTCGPAAAVTALRQFGLPAEESQIALAAHTSAAMGTEPDVLCLALQRLYRTNGLVCEYKHFNSISELKNGGITLAVIKFGFMIDHYVTILDMADGQIIAGDPLRGKVTYSQEEFKRKWRSLGVVLTHAALKSPEQRFHLSEPRF